MSFKKYSSYYYSDSKVKIADIDVKIDAVFRASILNNYLFPGYIIQTNTRFIKQNFVSIKRFYANFVIEKELDSYELYSSSYGGSNFRGVFCVTR